MCIFTNERDKGNQLFYWLCFGAWEFLHKWIKQITQFRNANEIIIKEFRKSSHYIYICVYILRYLINVIVNKKMYMMKSCRKLILSAEKSFFNFLNALFNVKLNLRKSKAIFLKKPKFDKSKIHFLFVINVYSFK